MTKSTALRASLAFFVFVLGNLQAWDSNTHEAGLLIVLFVSLAIALPPVALLTSVAQPYLAGAFALSLMLLILARLFSSIPLPGLFLILVPAALGLIFSGIIRQEA